MSGPPRIVVKHLYLYAALDRGHLSLVQCDDGTLRILLNEQPVPECRWEAAEMNAAAARFHELVARLRGTAS